MEMENYPYIVVSLIRRLIITFKFLTILVYNVTLSLSLSLVKNISSYKLYKIYLIWKIKGKFFSPRK